MIHICPFIQCNTFWEAEALEIWRADLIRWERGEREGGGGRVLGKGGKMVENGKEGCFQLHLFSLSTVRACLQLLDKSFTAFSALLRRSLRSGLSWWYNDDAAAADADTKKFLSKFLLFGKLRPTTFCKRLLKWWSRWYYEYDPKQTTILHRFCIWRTAAYKRNLTPWPRDWIGRALLLSVKTGLYDHHHHMIIWLYDHHHITLTN